LTEASIGAACNSNLLEKPRETKVFLSCLACHCFELGIERRGENFF
jgi:hypothetical protein